MAYVNSDIILMSDFFPAAAQPKRRFSEFLMIGRRWDIDIQIPVDFGYCAWEDQIRRILPKAGSLHAVTGIDYFVFTRNLWPGIPAFAIGRTTWDNWLVYYPLSQKKPVIDATGSVTAIHQNHHYGHLSGGMAEAFKGREAKRNRSLAGGCLSSGRIIGLTSDATWELTPRGLQKREFEARAHEETHQPDHEKDHENRMGRVNTLCIEGGRFLKASQPLLALQKFDDALKLENSHRISGIRYFRALALARLGSVDQAVDSLKNELRLTPDHAEAGDLLFKLNRFSEAARLKKGGMI
jgi:tetratricopeptide (TPR) repeat protein